MEELALREAGVLLWRLITQYRRTPLSVVDMQYRSVRAEGLALLAHRKSFDALVSLPSVINSGTRSSVLALPTLARASRLPAQLRTKRRFSRWASPRTVSFKRPLHSVCRYYVTDCVVIRACWHRHICVSVRAG